MRHKLLTLASLILLSINLTKSQERVIAPAIPSDKTLQCTFGAHDRQSFIAPDKV